MFYIKQIQVIKIFDGEQGFVREITPLTDWLDEDDGLKALEKYKETAHSEGWWWYEIKARERYVRADHLEVD